MKHTREMKLSQKIRTIRSEELSEFKNRLKEIYKQNIPDTGYDSIADLAIAVGKLILNENSIDEEMDWNFFGYVAEHYTYNEFVTYTVELCRKIRLTTNKFIDAAIDYKMPGHREVDKDVKKDKFWAAEVQNELDNKEVMIKGRIDSNYMMPIYANLNDIVYEEFLLLFSGAITDLINNFFTKDFDIDYNVTWSYVKDALEEKNGRTSKNIIDEEWAIDHALIFEL